MNRITSAIWGHRLRGPALALSAIVAVIIALLVMSNGDDEPGIIAGQPTPTMGEDQSNATPTPGTTPDPTSAPTAVPTAQPVECTAGRYELTIPAGWSTPPEGAPGHCVLFSPGPISLAPASDYQLEVDLAVTREPFEVAVRRIDQAPEYDIVDQATVTVSGRRSVRVDATTTGEGFAEAGARMRFYAVDLGDATLYAVANEWTVQSEATPDYDRNVAALDEMMSSIRLASAATPACVPPLPEGSDRSLGRAVYLEMDPGDDPSHVELLVPTGTNAAGTNWGLLTEVDCQWRQVAELPQHYSAASATDWSCLQLEDGVQIQTWDIAAGEVTTWSLDAARVALDEVTRARYSVLPELLGPESC